MIVSFNLAVQFSDSMLVLCLKRYPTCIVIISIAGMRIALRT